MKRHTEMNEHEREIIRDLIKRFTSDSYDPELKGRFQEWLANDTNREEKDEILFGVWNGTPSTGCRRYADKVFGQLKIRTGIARKKTLGRVVWRVAAVVGVPLLILSGILLYNAEQTPLAEGSAVEAVMGTLLEEGSNHTLLDDGSEVWTAMSAQLTIDEPRMNTLVGDALYKVKREHVEQRRFIVRTEHLTVTVLGTVFRVTALPGSDETVVTLYEGTLEIAMEGEKHIIETGTRFIYNNGTGEYTMEDTGALWPGQVGDEVYAFRSESVYSVVNEIEKLYGVTVDLTGYSWSTEVITLKFPSATNLENVLFMLSGITGNLDYNVTGDKVFIYDKR